LGSIGNEDVTEQPNQSFRMPTSDARPYLEQASALMKVGRFQEAIPLYESALATLERTYGVDQPELAECLQDLGDAYEAAYRLSDALAIHTRLLRIGEKVLGRTNPNVVAMLFKLAQINEMLGRPVDALAFCEQSLESAKQCLAQDDPLSQAIIERYNYLSTLVQTQAQQEIQPQAPAPDWQAESAPPQNDGSPPMPTNMQDFAREMLQDMPGSQRPFGQAVNLDNLSSARNPVQTAPTYPVPNTVAPPQFANQNNDYKSILEAGFSAAQNHNFRDDLPNSPNGGTGRASPNYPSLSTSSSPSAAPVYEPGGGGYSLSELDDIRAGRRDTGEMYTQTKTPLRRITEGDNKRIMIGRLAKDFALPVFGVVVLVGLLIFVLFCNKGTEQKPAVTAQDVGKAAAFGLFRTSDGEREVRLVSGNSALMVTQGSAIEVPYTQVTSNWGDLFSAMTSSIFEKQIWAEKKDYGLKTQDEVVYYASDGAEAKVIAKMRQLSGYAQAYFLKRGEYPRFVGSNMMSEFSFVNPLDGRGLPIPIKTLLSQVSDGQDAKGGLESGLEAGLAPNTEPAVFGNAPCSITCYAVVVGKPDDDLNKIRATSFFIRGCDRNGAFLASAQPGRTYVVPASNTYLAAVPSGALSDITGKAPAASRSKISTKAKIKGRVKALPKAPPNAAGGDKPTDDQDRDTAAQPALPVVHTEKPDKSTKLWLIVNPAFPMVLIHHSLPLILMGIAALAYLQSRIVHVEATGASIAETSNARSHYAKIAAAVFLGLAVLVIFVQFLIFG
jgi:tetratricopeptide (TPR) repeat protein